MQDQYQRQIVFRDIYNVPHIISSAINNIVNLSQQQLTLNAKVSTNMNPYTSIKVSSLINQIGQLIYQQAEESDLLRNENKASIIHEVQQSKIFPKDNMFTTGASIIANKNSNLKQNQRDDITSVNSFKTSFSKPRTKTISMTTQNNIYRQTNYQNLPKNDRLLKHKKSQIQFINLYPNSKSGRSRSSAFGSYNNNQQKILEQTIDQFRDQKIMQQQANLKHIENKKKMNTLLTKEQMVLAFGYQGDFVKISKRQFNIMMEKKANTKMAESLLVPGNYRFWKTKQKDKDKNQTSQHFYQNKQSSVMQNDPKIKTTNKKPRENQFKRTSIQKINEMKKNSIQIHKKKVITSDSQDKVDFQQYKKNLLDRGDSSLIYKSNKPLTQEQIKVKNHKMQFLINKLSQYHQKPQNSMTQWIQTVQNGCKLRIFVGKRKQSYQNIFINNKYSNDSQAVKQVNNKETRSYSQPRKRNQQNLCFNEDLGLQLKCVSNIKCPQREDIDLMTEWQKRKLIRTVDIRQEESKNLKNLNRNINTSRKSKQIQPDNFELSRSIKYGHAIKFSSFKNAESLQKGKSLQRQMQSIQNNSKKTNQSNELKANISQRKGSQDLSGQLIHNISSSSNQQPIINLNLQQFKIVKGYLQSKNTIFQKKQSISKYRTESILDNRKLTNKKNSKIYGQNDLNSEINDCQAQNNLMTIAQQNIFANNMVIKNEQPEQKGIKNVTFSQVGKNPPSTEKKTKNQGSIMVTNQRLKNSLLGSTSQMFISSSSILYTKKKTQKNQNIAELEKGNSIQTSQLQRISQSQKSFLPIQSQKKSNPSLGTQARANTHNFKKSLSLQKQKSLSKKLSIIQRKHHTTVIRTNNLAK